MLQTSYLELRFLWWLGVIKIWLLYKDYMLKFYKLIITTKINFNCNKACGGKLNLRIHIFCKSMALLRFRRSQQHHTKLVEPYFLFLHTFIINKLFIKH